MATSNIDLLKSAIDSMYCVDCSETDGTDVRQILCDYGLAPGSITKDELASVGGLNLFLRDLIGECLGMGCKAFSCGR